MMIEIWDPGGGVDAAEARDLLVVGNRHGNSTAREDDLLQRTEQKCDACLMLI